MRSRPIRNVDGIVTARVKKTDHLLRSLWKALQVIAHHGRRVTLAHRHHVHAVVPW